MSSSTVVYLADQRVIKTDYAYDINAINFNTDYLFDVLSYCKTKIYMLEAQHRQLPYTCTIIEYWASQTDNHWVVEGEEERVFFEVSEDR